MDLRREMNIKIVRKETNIKLGTKLSLVTGPERDSNFAAERCTRKASMSTLSSLSVRVFVEKLRYQSNSAREGRPCARDSGAGLFRNFHRRVHFI